VRRWYQLAFKIHAMVNVYIINVDLIAVSTAGPAIANPLAFSSRANHRQFAGCLRQQARLTLKR
jgi:hypothetical protein